MKYSKAQKIAKMGKYPFTFKTLWEKLPKDLIKRLTAKDLAIIIDIMYFLPYTKNPQKYHQTLKGSPNITQ